MWKLEEPFCNTKRLLETEILQRKSAFPVKKRFWPIFYRILDCDKPQGTNCKGPKGILAITVEAII